MHRYMASGLRLESDILLPGLIEIATDHSADVTIERRPVAPELADAEAYGPTWQSSGDTFMLRVPGVARFLLTGGRAVAYETETSDESDVAIFLIGTVLGILLHQRGQVVLHASAVRVGDRAVLFCGASGAGKSTMAAALGERGFALLADDVCAIGVTLGGPTAYPDGRLLKLWGHAIDQLELQDRRGAFVRAALQKFYVEPKVSTVEPLPLGAVYVLREERPPHRAGIVRPNIVDAALLLRRNAYRPMLVRTMIQQDNYFHATAAISSAAGIFHLTRALNFKELPQVAAGLEVHWRELGLLAGAG